ncbi:hypothetical protein FOC4_g10010551 [Fusarium odoratissimum]|uniref:Uncharacterized protein n=2 Tax=Fusarium oxysporum species complex TaxID=171631 RepID=N1RI25_FUSC4|nr:hypothetical protein FOC4_g10010551 [Fusarium odoratissimum]TXC10182.1 hypothetical protein FocTR4_00005608 [Fusarium oxysporum f. sp. cubense]
MVNVLAPLALTRPAQVSWELWDFHLGNPWDGSTSASCLGRLRVHERHVNQTDGENWLTTSCPLSPAC